MIRHLSHIFFVDGLTFIASPAFERELGQVTAGRNQSDCPKWLRATMPWTEMISWPNEDAGLT